LFAYSESEIELNARGPVIIGPVIIPMIGMIMTSAAVTPAAISVVTMTVVVAMTPAPPSAASVSLRRGRQRR